MEQSYSLYSSDEDGPGDLFSGKFRGNVLAPEMPSKFKLNNRLDLDEAFVEYDNHYRRQTSTPYSSVQRKQDTYSSESGIHLDCPKQHAKFSYVSSESESESDYRRVRNHKTKYDRPSKLNQVSFDTLKNLDQADKTTSILKSSSLDYSSGARPKTSTQKPGASSLLFSTQNLEQTNEYSREHNLDSNFTHAPRDRVYHSQNMYKEPISGYPNRSPYHSSFENRAGFTFEPKERYCPIEESVEYYKLPPPRLSSSQDFRQTHLQPLGIPSHYDTSAYNYFECPDSNKLRVFGNVKRKEKEADIFDGKTTEWVDYIVHFEQVAAWNGWNEREKAQQLTMCLRGAAQKILSDLTLSQLTDFRSLKTVLEQRFNPRENEIAYRCEFRNRKRKKDESAAEYGHSLRRLAQKAYPTLSYREIEPTVIDQYIHGLSHYELKKHVQFHHPQTLSQAIAFASEFEAFLGPLDKASKPREYDEQTNDLHVQSLKASTLEKPQVLEKEMLVQISQVIDNKLREYMGENRTEKKESTKV